MAGRATRVRIASPGSAGARSDATAARSVIDGTFLAAVLALGVATYVYGDAPAMSDDVCSTTEGGPRYPELLADGRITVAAVFGQLNNHGALDLNSKSARALASSRRARGFAETAPNHYEGGELVVDISVHPHDEAIVGRALTEAFATHELVYYTGHSDDGDIAFRAPDEYRIVVMDTCWSTQWFSERLVGDHRDVISNSTRSVTGSTESLLVILDGLRHRTMQWQPLIEDMNRRAGMRARARAPVSRYKAPEQYRLDSSCHGKSAGRDPSR
jgi:hypothetical protein